MLEITFKTNEDLFEEVRDLSIDNETRSIPVYEGFDYLSPIDFSFEGSEFNTNFICAYVNNEVVGVIKIKRYNRRNHKTVLEEDKDKVNNYIAIRYVDVREDMRRNGIATMLFEWLNDWIDDGQKIVMSPFSELGVKANLMGMAENMSKAKLIKI